MKVIAISNIHWVDLAVAASIACGLLLLAWLVMTVARRRLRYAAATATDLDDFLLELANRTRLWLLLVPAIQLGAGVLVLPAAVGGMIETAAQLSLIAQGAIWVGAVVEFALGRYHRTRVETDRAAVTTIAAFRFAATVGIWSIALLVALENLGVDIAPLITGLGIGGVAVALATQNILGDLFASLSIVLDKPFVVGDFIRTGQDMGTVEQIGLKTTRLRSLSGEQLVFSNAEILQTRLRNFTRMGERRALFRIGVTYSTSVDRLERIPAMVREIVERQQNVRFDRGHFATFGESAYEFEFVYFVLSPDYNAFMTVQQEINLAIVRAFEREEIAFAFPTRTVILEGGGGALSA